MPGVTIKAFSGQFRVLNLVPPQPHTHTHTLKRYTDRWESYNYTIYTSLLQLYLGRVLSPFPFHVETFRQMGKYKT